MDKKEILQQKKNRIEEIKPIICKSFPSDKELDKYIKKNQLVFDEYDELFIEIEQLEWELMSPEEQKKAEKRDRFLTLKAKGEPFDLDEFDDLNV